MADGTVPLQSDLWIDEWEDDFGRRTDVSTWIASLAERLKMIRERMVENSLTEKTKTKELYDQAAVERKVEAGSEALLKQPGLIGKLDTAWTGPYEVVRVISDTNVDLKLAGGNWKTRIVHINMTKPYRDPASRVLCVMVVAEDVEETETPPLLSEDHLLTGKLGELERVK